MNDIGKKFRKADRTSNEQSEMNTKYGRVWAAKEGFFCDAAQLSRGVQSLVWYVNTERGKSDIKLTIPFHDSTFRKCM